jgi:hypothetical protein
MAAMLRVRHSEHQSTLAVAAVQPVSTARPDNITVALDTSASPAKQEAAS